MPIDGTLQARYDAWRKTEDGERVYAEVRARALAAASAGDRRIGVKAIVEAVRADLKVKVNNSATALMARELYEQHPALRDLIELRQRSAA